MSYFSNNKLYNYYQLNEHSVGSNTITKDVIEIINNEEILFDLSEVKVLTTSSNILNASDVETVKIHIDWGDGNIDRLSIPLISNKSSIGSYRPNQWKVISHLFNVTKRYEYETDDINSLHQIKITAYNTFNDKLIIRIPYKMMYKTLYDLGSELSLFSSNTTNKNTVSYTLKQKQNDALFVVNSSDWRSIYGRNDVEVIKTKTVSDLFSDEFVNEDVMVWDWKSVPAVTLKVSYSDFDDKYIKCSFEEKGVAVEDWAASVLLKKDKGDVIIPTIKGEDFSFSTTNTVFEKGVYEVSVNPIVGINGVVGSSNKEYVLFDLLTYPRQLKCQKDVSPITQDDNNIYFNYTLFDGHQVKTITKAELTLSAEFVENDDNISDIKFSYDLLQDLYDEEGNLNYCDCEEECIGNCRNFKYAIPKRNIPDSIINQETQEVQNIRYTVSLKTNDVFGGSDSSLFYTNNGHTYDLSSDDNKVQFIYNIGNFIDYSDDNFVITEIDDVNKEIVLKWRFETNDEWDRFNVKIFDKDVNLITNDTHQWIMDDKFNKVSTEQIIPNETNKLEFIKYLNCNKIPNGNLDVTISYIVEMGDYYDKRQVYKTCRIENFEYPTPKITLDNIQPYVIINFNKLTNEQSLSLACDIISDYTEEELKDISITISENEGKAIKTYIPKLTYTHNLKKTIKDSNYDFVFSGANYYDEYSRVAHSNSSRLTITDDITKSLMLPNEGIDYIGADVAYLYTIVGGEDDGRVVDWTWLKEHTLHDINKTYKIKDTSLFGGDDMNYITVDGKVRRLLFDVITLKRAKQYIRRFIPYTQTVEVTENDTEELYNFNDIITSSHFPTIINDKGQLRIEWSCNNNIDLIDNFEVSKVKDMWLELKKGEKQVDRVDVKGVSNYTFNDLAYGYDYSYRLIMNSEYNKTDFNTQDYQTLSILIPNNQTVLHKNYVIANSNQNDKKYVTFRWDLKHQTCDDLIFYYRCVKINQETGEDSDLLDANQFIHAKLQQWYQPAPLPVGSRIYYGFKIKSQFLEDYTGVDENGYVVVNEKSFIL